MFCINCFHGNTQVKNSRPQKKQPIVWRRRKCPQCGATFTTLERPSLAHNKVIRHPDGSHEEFNIGKLIISIAESFGHDQERGKSQALWLAQTVEVSLSTELENIEIEDIEAVTHQTLRRFDETAAMQYALKHQLIVSAGKRRGRPSLVSRAPQKPQSPSR